MNAENLSTMSDGELVARLVELVRKERRLTAAVLLHLAEVEAKEIHLAAACPSLHVYCTRVLGMSEDEAFKRIRAARALRKYPLVAAAVADGRLHLTAVVLLAPHLDEKNAEALVAEASGKSKAEIEILLARRAPRADLPQRLERVAAQVVLVPDHASGDEVVLEPVPPVPPRVAPLSAERFALQLTISAKTREKILRAQALLRHKLPSGDLSELLDLAADALLEKVEKKRFGTSCAPRKAKRDLGDRPPVPVSIVARRGDEGGMRDVDLGDHIVDGRAWIAIALEPCVRQIDPWVVVSRRRGRVAHAVAHAAGGGSL